MYVYIYVCMCVYVGVCVCVRILSVYKNNIELYSCNRTWKYP